MKTAKEILERAYFKLREKQSSEHTIVDPIMLEAMEEYASQFKVDKWIKIEDSEDMIMPPFEEKSQIICADGEQYIGYFNGADRHGYVWFCDNNDYHYPTHWQPLPKPPIN